MDTAQAAAIQARQTYKSQILNDARRDRVEQYREQHSHVGVDLARGMVKASPAVQLATYKQLAGLANKLFAAGHEPAGRVIASLCRGFLRGTAETFGKDVANAMAETIIDEPGFEPIEVPRKPQTHELTGVATPAPASGPPADDELDLTTGPDISEREAGTGFITDMPGDSEPPYGVDLKAPDGQLTAAVIDRIGIDEEYEPEHVDSTKAAVSPEPDPDAMARAQARRAAKRAAKGLT